MFYLRPTQGPAEEENILAEEEELFFQILLFPMHNIWRLINKPRIDDWSPLAKFYYADDALTAIATELDNFDGRKDPERCNQLVSRLRQAQERVLQIISEMLVLIFPHESDRACRDYRAKFPDEILHDNLPGQLWFGAECLAAGSNIVDREAESEVLRPMAKTFVRHLEKLRDLLKEQAIRDPGHYPDSIKSALRVFDQLLADFEFAYVSAMVPVKSAREYDRQLDVAVLFSECLTRAIKTGHIAREQIDDCDPNVIIALPRLAIIWGLIYFPRGALNVELPKEDMSEMFRHFHKLLVLVHKLVITLSSDELERLEQKLVSGSGKGQADQQSAAESSRSVNALEKQIEPFAEATTGSGKQSEYDPRDDFPEPGVPYVLRNPRCSQLIPMDDADKNSSVDRSLYGSSDDLVHRLFVCVAGIADQLQTNYSSDIRKVLKMVLQPVDAVPVYEVNGKTAQLATNEEETGVEVRESLPLPAFIGVRWVPDSDCAQCTACSTIFTFVRRRHHCRNCGRIFCGTCSASQIPIPELGYEKKVRVCDLCHEYRLKQQRQQQQEDEGGETDREQQDWRERNSPPQPGQPSGTLPCSSNSPMDNDEWTANATTAGSRTTASSS